MTSAPPRVLAALLFGAVLFASCRSASASFTPQATPPAPVSALAQTIAAALGDPALSRATWGIAVRSMDQNESLYRLGSDRLMMPASTLKVVTLAAAAQALGWDFSYTTALHRIGSVTQGTLDGDLLITGTGDPSFDDWDGQATTRFAEWAARLKEIGITSVTGRIIGDDDAFEEHGLGNGWAWDDVAASYATAVGGLQFNENTAQLVVTPGPTGDRPRVEVRPATTPLDVRNLATTATGGPPLLVQPRPRSTAVELTGAIAPNAAPVVRNVSVPNPTLYFVTAAKAALAGNGIDIRGGAVDIDDLSQPVDRSVAVPIADFTSPPLRSLAGVMMKLSQNLFAESLLKTMGGTAGTAAAGLDRVRESLASWGIDADDLVMVDGSGLSRYNLITPDAQLAVLTRVYGDTALRAPFVDALPLAGATGTLEYRMRGTGAEKNARAKTGSFSNARGLAGFVTTVDGETLAFSILVNNYNAPAATADRAIDSIVVALSQLSRR